MPDVNMSVFEEARRNQLVTEVDIQTQVALEDYQVKLANIANPTQSQDNVVIDRFGEFLPHWNESLDFDIWVKMSMEVAGKRILMLRGNSNVSNASSIDDTMIFGYEPVGTTIDTSKWTVTGSVTQNDVLILNSTGCNIVSISTFGDNTILEFSSDIALANDFLAGFYKSADYNAREWIWSSSRYLTRSYEGGTLESNEDGGGRASGLHYNKIERYNNGTFKFYYTDGQTYTHSTYTPDNTHDLNISFKSNTYYSGNNKIYNIFLRKYVATTELTYTTDTSKNISTALKSLGRAG